MIAWTQFCTLYRDIYAGGIMIDFCDLAEKDHNIEGIEVRNHTISVHVRTARDVALLKKLLDRYEAKSIYIGTKKEFCMEDNLWIYTLAKLRYKPGMLLRYLRCIMKPFHQVLHTYNVRCDVYAFIYKPWRVVVRDYGGYNWLYNGALEKIYQKLRVKVDGYKIEIYVGEW